MIFKMSLFLTIWIHIQACIWYQFTKYNGIVENHIPKGGEFIHLIDGEPPFERLIGYCAEKRQGFSISFGCFLDLKDVLYDIDIKQSQEDQYGYEDGICSDQNHNYFEMPYEPWHPP